MQIQEISYHRNGVCGAPFWAVLFRHRVAGAWQDMFATVFDEPGHCAVISLTALPETGVAFGANSWRGDHFEDQLRAAIREKAGE